MWDNLFSSVNLLQKGFDAANTRYKVIANNIANVDTPGFKASNVEFEDLMANALGINNSSTNSSGLTLATTDTNHISSASQAGLATTDSSQTSGADTLGLTTTDSNHIGAAASSVEPKVVQEDTSLRYDENNVDIESEMSELAKNTINYYALTTKVNSEFAKFKTAING
jgi:flagellar basal-body rod protein FlgB